MILCMHSLSLAIPTTTAASDRENLRNKLAMQCMYLHSNVHSEASKVAICALPVNEKSEASETSRRWDLFPPLVGPSVNVLLSDKGAFMIPLPGPDKLILLPPPTLCIEVLFPCPCTLLVPLTELSALPLCIEPSMVLPASELA